MENKDNIIAKGKWRFDTDVAKVFTDMLERSIPEYTTMREMTYLLANYFLKKGTVVADMGCSNGLSASRLIKHHIDDCKFVLFDNSEPMLQKCRAMYSNELDTGHLFISNIDATEDWNLDNRCSVVQSILTLQFIPKRKRINAVDNAYKSLMEGGVFLIVEKVTSYFEDIEKAFSDEYYNMKRENAYTEEQIASKRKSLKGVLEPMTVDENIIMLREAGFRKVDTYWRCLNFVGIIAIK